MLIDPKLKAQLTDSPTVRSIIKLIGEELYLRFSEDFGGRQLYIPENPGEHSPLTVSIGIDAARKMGEIWGGIEYEVPVMAGRRAIILRMAAAGMPTVRISAHLRLSIRTVRRIVNASKEAAQMPLFPEPPAQPEETAP